MCFIMSFRVQIALVVACIGPTCAYIGGDELCGVDKSYYWRFAVHEVIYEDD